MYFFFPLRQPLTILSTICVPLNCEPKIICMWTALGLLLITESSIASLACYSFYAPILYFFINQCLPLTAISYRPYCEFSSILLWCWNWYNLSKFDSPTHSCYIMNITYKHQNAKNHFLYCIHSRNNLTKTVKLCSIIFHPSLRYS